MSSYKSLNSSQKGELYNTKYGLSLKFQFNPTELPFEKAANYSESNPTGIDSPFLTWTSGGAYTVSFTISIDSRGVNSTKFGSILVTAEGKAPDESKGCLPHIATLQSFLRPANSPMSLGSMSQALGMVSGGSRPVFVAPPDCYFKYGSRVFRCKMKSAPYKEVLHNDKLVPVRIDADITLQILEYGSFAVTEANERKTILASISDIFINFI